jgi:two-component system chemotaxis response regulator CheV
MAQATMEKQDILRGAGTNELEILVFSLGPTHYGVNVAKVREIIGQVKLTSVPMTHPAVLGVFKLRDAVIPLVDLQLYFKPDNPSEAEHRTVILMEFNDRQIGFMVDSVDNICRMSWDEVRPFPTVEGGEDSVIISVCQADDRLVLMIDFEKIAFEISGDDDAFRAAAEAQTAPTARGAQRVLLVEDSPTIRGAIRSNLIKAGYGEVVTAPDGSQGWAVLEASLSDEGSKPFTVIVTDIEMPQMDGLHLCKRIKEHPRLKNLPVIVFSSLVSDANLEKCKAVGADAAITKPQMAKLVELLDQLLQARPSTDGRTAG